MSRSEYSKCLNASMEMPVPLNGSGGFRGSAAAPPLAPEKFWCYHKIIDIMSWSSAANEIRQFTEINVQLM